MVELITGKVLQVKFITLEMDEQKVGQLGQGLSAGEADLLFAGRAFPFI